MQYRVSEICILNGSGCSNNVIIKCEICEIIINMSENKWSYNRCEDTNFVCLLFDSQYGQILLP